MPIAILRSTEDAPCSATCTSGVQVQEGASDRREEETDGREDSVETGESTCKGQIAVLVCTETARRQV